MSDESMPGLPGAPEASRSRVRRNVYLTMCSVAEARRALDSGFAWPGMAGTEEIEVAAATGRVLALPVHAAFSSPAGHLCAMDGIAIRAEDSFGASEAAPRDLRVGAAASFVNTGEVLPEGCDAVVMIEQVQDLGEVVRIEAPVFPWQNVRRAGEDIVAGEMLFVRGHRVRPADVGAMLAGGVLRVQVLRRPRILVIATGAEMLAPEDVPSGGPPRGRLVEFGSTVLGLMVDEAGAEWVRGDRQQDDPEVIAAAIDGALAGGLADAVLLIGGSSAGSRDFTRAAIERIGRVLVHGVTMMPGKPFVLGEVRGRPVFGMPGYPVSSILAFEQFVSPAIAAMLGVAEARRTSQEAVLTRKVAGRLGMDEFVRVRLGRVGPRTVATPMPRGAGAITTLTQADAILRLPAELEGLPAGREATVELLRDREEIENAVVAVGSHDLCLDVLADLLRAGGSGVRLSSSHVGSTGGLLAIKRGVCHLAGCHLLDPDDGSYNVRAVARLLPGVPLRLVRLVERQQGLMVRQGNPLAIEGLPDLARPDVMFVNRQAGSGTRVLLDRELARLGIGAGSVRGYTLEEHTHMAVAVAVQSGAADAGMGILAAARALGLGFVPVAQESYDLVIPEEHMEHPGLLRLLDVVGSREFRARVAALGGYDTGRTGERVG